MPPTPSAAGGNVFANNFIVFAGYLLPRSTAPVPSEIFAFEAGTQHGACCGSNNVAKGGEEAARDGAIRLQEDIIDLPPCSPSQSLSQSTPNPLILLLLSQSSPNSSPSQSTILSQSSSAIFDASDCSSAGFPLPCSSCSNCDQMQDQQLLGAPPGGICRHQKMARHPSLHCSGYPAFVEETSIVGIYCVCAICCLKGRA